MSQKQWIGSVYTYNARVIEFWMILFNKFNKITIECFREIRATVMGIVEKPLIWWYVRLLGSDFIIFGLKGVWRYWIFESFFSLEIISFFYFYFFGTIEIYYKLFAFGAIVLSTLGQTTWATLVFIRFKTKLWTNQPNVFFFKKKICNVAQEMIIHNNI
jgi:hypothetical protein